MDSKYSQINNKNPRIHILTNEERRIIIELICDKQTKMIVENCMKYESSEYKELENLKITIKNM